MVVCFWPADERPPGFLAPQSARAFIGRGPGGQAKGVRAGIWPLGKARPVIAPRQIGRRKDSFPARIEARNIPIPERIQPVPTAGSPNCAARNGPACPSFAPVVPCPAILVQRSIRGAGPCAPSGSNAGGPAASSRMLAQDHARNSMAPSRESAPIGFRQARGRRLGVPTQRAVAIPTGTHSAGSRRFPSIQQSALSASRWRFHGQPRVPSNRFAKCRFRQFVKLGPPLLQICLPTRLVPHLHPVLHSDQHDLLGDPRHLG